MLAKPNWDVFKAKFHNNPQEYFECFQLFTNNSDFTFLYSVER